MKRKFNKRHSFLAFSAFMGISLLCTGLATFIYSKSNISSVIPDVSKLDPQRMLKTTFKSGDQVIQQKDFFFDVDETTEGVYTDVNVTTPDRKLLDKTKKFSHWKVISTDGTSSKVDTTYFSDFNISKGAFANPSQKPDENISNITLEAVYRTEDVNNPSIDKVISDAGNAPVTIRPGATDAKDPTIESSNTPKGEFGGVTFDNNITLDFTDPSTGEPKPVSNIIRARQQVNEPSVTSDPKQGGFMTNGKCEYVNRAEYSKGTPTMNHVYSAVLNKPYNVLNIRLNSDLIIDRGGKFVLEAQTGTNGGGFARGGAVISGEYTSLDLNGHNIHVRSGGTLISYGIIYDSSATKSGKIYIDNGGEMCTNFCVEDYSGGTFTVGAYSTGNKSAPFIYHSSPYINVPMEVYYGGRLYEDACLTTGMHLSGTIGGVNSTCINFIGETSDFLFQIASGNKLVRSVIGSHIPDDTKQDNYAKWKPYIIDYKEVYEFVKIDKNSNNINNVNALSLPIKTTVVTVNISMKDVHFPISPWYSLRASDGAKLRISQRVDFLPGSELIIDKDSTFVMGTSGGSNCGILALGATNPMRYYTVNPKPAEESNPIFGAITGFEAYIDIKGKIEFENSTSFSLGGKMKLSETAQKNITSNWEKLTPFDWSVYYTGDAGIFNRDGGAIMQYHIAPLSVFKNTKYYVVNKEQNSDTALSLTNYQMDWLDLTLKQLTDDGKIVKDSKVLFFKKTNDGQTGNNISSLNPNFQNNTYVAASSYYSANLPVPNNSMNNTTRDIVLIASDGTNSYIPFAGTHIRAFSPFNSSCPLYISYHAKDASTEGDINRWLLGTNNTFYDTKLANANNSLALNSVDEIMINANLQQFGGNGNGNANLITGDNLNILNALYSNSNTYISYYFDDSGEAVTNGPTSISITGRNSGKFNITENKKYNIKNTKKGFGFLKFDKNHLAWRLY